MVQCDLGNGDHYEGGLEGKPRHKQGYGVYTWASGDKYTGDWEKDVMSGHGVYIFNNGSRYEGEFLNGQFHGEGILHYQAQEDDDIV